MPIKLNITMRFWRKYHRWAGFILSVFFFLFTFSGIVLNHRSLFSSFSVSRDLLSISYKYSNWNNATVRNGLCINNDSTLFYGNIGCWLKVDGSDNFLDFNQGFITGIDNRKITKLFKTSQNRLFAGTLFGLFERKDDYWSKIELPVDHQRITDIIEHQDTLLILTRSELCLLPLNQSPEIGVEYLPTPDDYDHKESLFKTLWVIHSGEIFGLTGKLMVDVIGLLFLFFSITGIIWFISPRLIKRARTKLKPIIRKQKIFRFSVKWHNRLGIYIVFFLLITTLTGMFLRPPLLIPIAKSKVGKIPGTLLDSPNGWFDKLRAIRYNDHHDVFLVSTSNGFYALASDRQRMIPIPHQPPVSVMGITIFESTSSTSYLIGSFNGLYQWDPFKMTVHNYLTGERYTPAMAPSRPISDYMASGYFRDELNAYYFDYNHGVVQLNGTEPFPDMPENILKESPMSLWNFMLEIHTARIFQDLIGSFYILIIPLTGLATVFLLLSGVWIWWRRHWRRSLTNWSN